MHYLSEYQTFDSKRQLNEAIADHLAEHRYELNNTARNVLTFISRHAVKFPGVAHLKAATIAQALNVCEKTVRRAINKLSTLGIIKKVSTTRKITGGQGANIFVVQPYVQAEVSTRDKSENTATTSGQPTENTNEPYHSFKQKELLCNTYAHFKSLISSFVDDRKLTNRLYGIYLAQTSYLRNTYDKDDLFHAGLQAVKVTFQAMKKKKVRNIAGYFNGVLDRMLDRLYYKVISEA
ncbi:helix-turn-helix domain-containing protein [Heyndrickxia ginsengihumi]|uniref:helix-turn-helix domain-containing protein n=1 Tax=Heyndrickxia ginsengihumi TaxID=363870 RepID=UPI003D205847